MFENPLLHIESSIALNEWHAQCIVVLLPDLPLLLLGNSVLPFQSLLDTLFNPLLLIDHQVGLVVELSQVVLNFDNEFFGRVSAIYASVDMAEATRADHLGYFVSVEEQDTLCISDSLLGVHSNFLASRLRAGLLIVLRALNLHYLVDIDFPILIYKK